MFFTIILNILLIFHDISTIYPYEGSETSEMTTQGRMQYKLLHERGNLPRYGSCWKNALETVDIGCRELSEETQSDIALALTNCFLEMSGLETYNCDYDKKENVRHICISSMSDKAFNSYTEFYTHTFNMCWFLRGQIWQETISENTRKVGKQLESSAVQQEKLLNIQRESLELQEQMLRHGRIIETVLANLSIASQNHHDMLMLMGRAVTSLQSWLIGEISWVNTLIFYITSAIFSVILTSTPRTISSRLPILTLLVSSIISERLVCALILSENDFQTSVLKIHGNIHDCIQFLRYFFLVLSLIIYTYKAYFYEDALSKTMAILDDIHAQNKAILSEVTDNFKFNNNLMSPVCHSMNENSFVKNNNLTNVHEHNNAENLDCSKSNSVISCISSRVKITPIKEIKYNLRSRQNTPIP